MSKKILILSMSCNVDRYRKEEQAIKETWGKDIEKYPNMSLYFYRGGSDKNVLNKATHEILLKCGDNLSDTYTKTILAFILSQNLEFDYIVRTNTTTYLNLKLINDMVEALDDQYELYGGRLISNRASEYIPFFRGCFLMMPKEMVKELISTFVKYKLKGPDDICMAKTLFLERKNEDGMKDYLSLLKEVDCIEKIELKEYFNKIQNAVYIRAKENKTGEHHVEILKTLYDLINKQDVKFELKMPHMVTKVETIRGIINLKMN